MWLVAILLDSTALYCIFTLDFLKDIIIFLILTSLRFVMTKEDLLLDPFSLV